tara:strand:- start:358 stop:525 length:168 start_codon:yes stop_codon:yes gene_type:complete
MYRRRQLLLQLLDQVRISIRIRIRSRMTDDAAGCFGRREGVGGVMQMCVDGVSVP